MSNNCGYSIWSYRVNGEMHSTTLVHSIHREMRKYKKGDVISMELDMDRHSITFFKNGQEMWSFTELSSHVTPFVNLGEVGQKVAIKNIKTDFG